ncbi:sensor histidine kinase/response regulator [Penicillium angulare]|uniref:sensor histidine kinase/response regulator n=1 Tax=Penicillium angulare TaxID=116970 RepID=UPI00253FDDEA|nr:sensor histidine kinase/response regulator [Penicillium angulare]KAJ5263325.1 sensor histidine kinase/response regulator [Penicillium angulare]
MTPSTTGKGREGPRKYAYNIDAAREREMHLYLPYWGFSESEKFAQQSVGERPNVSRDNVLTAFAQLASLRLHAKCALISLFDRTTQHVVAEATPTLGLRSSKSGEGSDSLWRGVQQFPRQNIPMCDRAMRAFTKEGESRFMIPDLTQDSCFKSASFVTGAPHHRFYISVPIRSPEHYIIGSVAILDDKPRENMSTQDMHFLEELSVTIMEYLLSQRAMREENREEKMVRALGLFVRGKSDLSEGIDSRDISDHPPDGLDHVNKKLEEIQISDQAGTNATKSNRGRTSTSSIEQAVPTSVDQSRSRSPVRKFKMSENQGEESDIVKEENEQRPALTRTTERLQKSLAPSSVQSVLNRASCLMNQALEIEGAMFIDASVYARRQMMGVGSDSAVHKGADNEQNQNQNGHRGSEIPPELQPDSVGDDNEPRSLVLGYSTSTASGRDDNKLESHYVPLPGSFVNHLIERYPRGKIFHIDKDGSIAVSYEGLADDVSQAYVGKENEVKPGSPKEKGYQEETMEIKHFHKILPDARCLAIYPVWDFHRGRWFTMSLAWTNDPGRVLSEPKDLTYMAAFSNTVMADVSRMDVEAADKAKGDFISSISHELRSPLHGVLGTVELLQETVNSYTQQGLVETVHSCGRTLLDTLNHLLDYARINTLTASPGRGPGGSATTNRERPKISVPGLEQDEDLSSLVQEVVEGLLAGAEFQSRESGTSTDIVNQNQQRFSLKSSNGGKESRMMTIVDIEWQDNWHYPVYAGAWRRVVMNLFGNALKYTGTGYIRLFMRKDTMTVNGQKNVPAARLTISDSGRGMSQDFLLHNLYIPFLQENTQSPGLGVGLHLVHQIVKSLNGQIHFKSEVDRGTEVDVYFPLTEPQPTLVQPTHYHQLRTELSGKSVSFFTKSFQRGDLGIRPEIFDNIRFSLGRMVSDWFGLQVISSDEPDHEHGPDFLIVTEHEYRTMARDSAQSDVRRSVESRGKYPLIVLSGQASSWRVVKENDRDRAIFLSQPVSPRTLATVFENCLRPQGIEEDVKNVKQGSPDSSQSSEQRNDTSDKTEENSEKRVLLVEDNAVNLKIIETCVKNCGFKYESATNGVEASEKFKDQRFDIIVMDISMPHMDGLTATRNMRKFEKAHKLTPAHIIILTAVLSSEKQEEARVSGVNDFLTKPTPLKQLSQLLRTLPHLNNPENLD